MIRKYLTLSAIMLAGTCVGLAPAWSAGSSSSSSDQSPKGSMRQSSGSSSSDSGSATDSGKSTTGSSMHRRSGGQMAGQGNVKQVQEALKDKGFDPGPIDGVMGHKTQEALRSFQQSKNLKVTGRLDSETAQQLGISSSPAGGSSMGSSPSSSSDMRPSPGTPKSDTNTGTSDSPSSGTSQMPGGSTRGSNTGSGH